MTTILADFRLGLVVADSNITDACRVWKTRKVFRAKGALVGIAGLAENFLPFMVWCRSGMEDPPPKVAGLEALILSEAGLLFFSASTRPIRIDDGRHAIGTGAMAAMAAHEALGYTDPKRAVQIVCRHDAGSRGPVRTYRL